MIKEKGLSAGGAELTAESASARGERRGNDGTEMGECTLELVFILDKSGSMSGMEKDTVGGFNSLIEAQKKEGSGDALVTTVLFSNDVEILHDRLPLAKISPITEREYRVGGCTALYDAIGSTVEHIMKVHRYIRRADLPTRTLFVITTDGEENASRKYSSRRVREMITERETEGWEFLFLAANIDAFSSAESIGISRNNAASYSVAKETGAMYDTVCGAVSYYRAHGRIDAGWSGDLGESDPRSTAHPSAAKE